MSQTAKAVIYGKTWVFLPSELPPPAPFSSSPIPNLTEAGNSFGIPEKLHKTAEADNIVCFEFKMRNVYACGARRMKECPFQNPYLKRRRGGWQMSPFQLK